MINGKTRTCGLIGCPVEHTMSPAIHNNLAELMEIDLAYVPFFVKGDGLEDAVKGAFALNLLGLNVTVPYKSDVIPFLTDIDPLAKRIGAVNTLVRKEDGYKGYNTDMPGLYRAMENDGVKLKDEKVLILGAGGVARAVAVMLAEKGAKEIIIINRTTERAQKIAEEVNGYMGKEMVRVLSLSDTDKLGEEEYLAIQATSVGMYPNIDEAVIEDAEFYRHIHTGYDLVFNPRKTKFMELVEQKGGRAFNGLKMLLYQGIIAFELWNEVEVSDHLAEQIYDIING